MSRGSALGILNPGPLQAAAGLIEGRRAYIVKVDLPLSLHRRGEGERLASRSAAVIEDEIVRASLDELSDELAPLVLNFEEPLFEFRQRKEGFSFMEMDSLRGF